VWAGVTPPAADTPDPAAAELARGNQFIVAAYERILSRRPTDLELTACIEFLKKQTALITESKAPDAANQARESLVRALLNHNDFITIR
jgi:hypothetical protein